MTLLVYLSVLESLFRKVRVIRPKHAKFLLGRVFDSGSLNFIYVMSKICTVLNDMKV